MRSTHGLWTLELVSRGQTALFGPFFRPNIKEKSGLATRDYLRTLHRKNIGKNLA